MKTLFFLKKIRGLGCGAILALLLAASCYSPPPPKPETPEAETPAATVAETAVEEEIIAEVEFPSYEVELPVSSFGEIWGYLVAGRESALGRGYPLSDIGYFGAEIDNYGKLVNVPDRKKISGYPGRVHLVVTCNSRPLTHFALEEGSAVRRRMIADLLAETAAYDGLQIDFEYVPAQDGGAFLSFLSELRKGLAGKMFTIALPARTRTLANDVYDYGKINALTDRILVMAYDEHWSGSQPGPIASMGWCRDVASYSLATLGPGKLIMGLPFYGRAWGHTNPSRAYIHSSIERLKEENKVSEVIRTEGIPHFSYEIPVSVTVYYEDAFSLSARMEMYTSLGVKAIGFWSLGQENPEFWKILELKETNREEGKNKSEG
ncbi:MAG: glycoside hydrolase [Treponema sp.]|jgi:spore germination protein YaaH|nr:glycoside hydrolase [Treponema sp.]